MIREIKGERLCALSLSDPFFVRIQSLSLCYADKLRFVRFYEQRDELGETVSLCADFEGRMSLYMTESSDLDEIGGFVKFSGCSSVMYNAGFLLDINSVKEINGDVLSARNHSIKEEKEVFEPEIKAYYQVLKSCEREDFPVPEYLPFLSDVTHRKNQGKCTLLGIRREGVTVSVAMTVYEGNAAVIIGAVATREPYRRQGLSSCLVNSLAEKYRTQNREVFVFSANEQNTRFYERSGFQKYACFTEKFFR